MADAKPKTISVTALKYHTYQGKEYQEGASYDVEETQAENLVAQGMAKRTHDAPAPAPKASQPVAPMTTDDLSPKQKPK